ncbi:uncharacterized protein LOC143018475 [Oratosquilla oratoria]|uniref:uncharacterized protein LOC143018475 n=1 Tax=Oratosquilla oratoria TaxID=337810 RepID=UPI003F76343A
MGWLCSMSQSTSPVLRTLWNRKGLQSLMQCHTPMCGINFSLYHAHSTINQKHELRHFWKPLITSKVTQSKFCITQSRSNFLWLKPPKKEEDYRIKDQMEPHYDLIYKSTFYNHLQIAYGISGIGYVWLAGLFSCDALGFPIVNITQELLNNPVQGATLAFSYVAFTWAIFVIAHRYIVRMYYSEVEDQFVAVMTGLLPYTKRKVVIHPGTAIPVGSSWIATLIPWHKDIYKTPVQKLIMFSHYFRYPVYFNKILGYES